MGEQSSENSSEGSRSPGDSMHLMRLPDSLLLDIFMSLPLQAVVSASLTCSRFSRIARDEELWKRIFRRDFKVRRSVPLHPRACSWWAEYRRLFDESPSVLCEEVLRHKDQALHISFSHNGQMFATSSKDGTIKVWNATTPCTLRFDADMKALFKWRYTQYCQFNKSDTLLLISGVHEGDNTTTGEIAVFDLTQDFRFMSRVLNKPYDVFGAWYDDSHLLLGTLRWIGHLESISSVWLAKTTRHGNSKRRYAMINPWRFNNFNASSIRTIMVADVPVVTEESQPSPDGDHSICNECGLDIYPGETFIDSDDGNVSNTAGMEEVDVEVEGREVIGRGNPSKQGSVGNESTSTATEGLGPLSSATTLAHRGKALSKHSAEANALGSSGLNHSPAKNACHRDFDQEACSRDSLSSAAPCCLDGFWCCCFVNSTASPRVLQDSSRGVKGKSSRTSSDSSGWVNQPQPSASRLTEPSKHASVQSNTPTPHYSNPSSPKYQHASYIPRMTSLARSKRTALRTEKLLIFTLGEETYSPHLVGIKRMTEDEIQKEENATEGLHWPETEEGCLPYTDRDTGGTGRSTNLDCTINMHGHIVGMALSPDQRYLYVNSRQWPNNYKIVKVMEPPPIAQEIDIHVIDLVTFEEVGTIMRSHKAYTPNDECFFLFLDVSELYVASGAEDKRGYMWDRHYGVHLRCFPHSDVVNSCAFNPADPEMLVTVSDDNKIKIWRSRRQMRELHKREGKLDEQKL
ncbi:hypothetical protein V1264_006210 [Littorina saxatilis]|uniref:F-box domain-containing protein n=2 Tax=Littorina saxatilis TaxID=31220 RepID=A0AAN9G4N3_9CAEN